VNQAMVSDINKHLEAWSSIPKNGKKIKKFNEPSLGLWYEGLGNGPSTNSLRFEVQSERMKKKSKTQIMWAKPGLKYQQTGWGLKFNHKE
jgi:hypothetical protein